MRGGQCPRAEKSIRARRGERGTCQSLTYVPGYSCISSAFVPPPDSNALEIDVLGQSPQHIKEQKGLYYLQEKYFFHLTQL